MSWPIGSNARSAKGDARQRIMEMTAEHGVDTAIEAVGIPATFELCEQIVAPGDVIAYIGVRGTKVDLHLKTSGIATLPSPHAWSTP